MAVFWENQNNNISLSCQLEKLPTPQLAVLSAQKNANLRTSSVSQLKLKLNSESEAEINPTH